MTWKVFREDFNKKIIEKFNIFDHSSFYKDVKEAARVAETKEVFADLVQRSLRYYFWAKAEHEVVITSWPPYIDKTELDRLNAEYEEYHTKWGHYPRCLNVNLTVDKKMDVYSQVMLHWNVFIDYVWENREKL